MQRRGSGFGHRGLQPLFLFTCGVSCGELNPSAQSHAKQQTGRTCCTAQHSTWEETVKRCIYSYVSRHVTPLANSPALPPVAQVTHTHRLPHTRALTLFICPVVGEWRESWSPVSSLSLGLSLVTPPMVASEVTVLVMAKLAVTGLQSILLPFCSSVATTTPARQVCDRCCIKARGDLLVCLVVQSNRSTIIQ